MSTVCYCGRLECPCSTHDARHCLTAAHDSLDAERAKVANAEEGERQAVIALRDEVERRQKAEAKIERLRGLLSRTLDFCKYWSDDFKDEVREALAALKETE